MSENTDCEYMTQALELAEKAYRAGEVPVGALYVVDNEVIASSHNLVEATPSALEHAELRVIREASRILSKWRLLEGTLYVTLEPCVMCASAIRFSRIPRIVYGAPDIRHGGFGSLIDLRSQTVFGTPPEVIGGIMEEESKELLRSFFKERR